MNGYDRDNIGTILSDRERAFDWFNADLLRLIQHADSSNMLLLAAVFPEQVAAVLAWRETTMAERVAASALRGLTRPDPLSADVRERFAYVVETECRGRGVRPSEVTMFGWFAAGEASGLRLAAAERSPPREPKM